MEFGANGESTGLAETSEPARKSLMYQATPITPELVELLLASTFCGVFPPPISL